MSKVKKPFPTDFRHMQVSIITDKAVNNTTSHQGGCASFTRLFAEKSEYGYTQGEDSCEPWHGGGCRDECSQSKEQKE